MLMPAIILSLQKYLKLFTRNPLAPLVWSYDSALKEDREIIVILPHIWKKRTRSG
jgi:hypothetical protein